MTTTPNILQFLKAGLLAGIAAAGINAALFLVFQAMDILPNAVRLPPDNTPMTVVPVILSSLIPSLLASLVFYLLARFTQNGYRYFTIIAIILLVLSFGNPFFAIPNVPVSYAVALNVMHIVVAGCLLYSFKKLTSTSYSQT